MKSRVRELEIRERIAMIERGLVPPPEVDPRGFDRAMHRLERREVRSGAGRHRRAGVTVMGVGFGLMVLIAFAGGDSGTAIGVGGFLAVIGLAFFINSLIDNQLRVSIQQETTAVREMIVAQAFSDVDVIDDRGRAVREGSAPDVDQQAITKLLTNCYAAPGLG